MRFYKSFLTPNFSRSTVYIVDQFLNQAGTHWPQASKHLVYQHCFCTYDIIMWVFVYVCVCVFMSPRLSITVQLAAIAGIVSRHGLTIEACHRKQSNKSTLVLVLYKPNYFYFKSAVHISNKMKLPMYLLYSHKVLKTFNCHLNHKHKFTKVIGNTLCINFDRLYWNRTKFKILYTVQRESLVSG